MTEQIVTWSIAVGGWLIALITTFLGYLERRRTQERELLLQNVAYFDGGTQRRSIGIALIEGLIRRRRQHRDVLLPLLANQFVYLLCHPEVKQSVHEERNLVRLYRLLSETPEFADRFHEVWCDVADAIERRLGGEKSGLLITEVTLSYWKKGLRIV